MNLDGKHELSDFFSVYQKLQFDQWSRRKMKILFHTYANCDIAYGQLSPHPHVVARFTTLAMLPLCCVFFFILLFILLTILEATRCE